MAKEIKRQISVEKSEQSRTFSDHFPLIGEDSSLTSDYLSATSVHLLTIGEHNFVRSVCTFMKSNHNKLTCVHIFKKSEHFLGHNYYLLWNSSHLITTDKYFLGKCSHSLVLRTCILPTGDHHSAIRN